MDAEKIKSEVKTHYAAIAQQGECGCGCCSSAASDAVELVDYGLLSADVVPGADLGLGCGLPTQFASLQPGETVLDLGSGAGIDVFIAAKAVGQQGRVIGVDMTPEMIARAQANAARSGFHNVEFRLGEIEALPVDSGSVDVVLSNCVLNLVPDKSRAFAEIHRVLKPGGRISISDVVTFGAVPESLRQDMELWAGCISGAMDRDEYLALIERSGFSDLKVNQSSVYNYEETAGYGIANLTFEARKA
jgi:arsenite methyltransferase